MCKNMYHRHRGSFLELISQQGPIAQNTVYFLLTEKWGRGLSYQNSFITKK